MYKKAIIHVHTCHSFDSFAKPSKIVDLAVKEGINLLCISDHDTIKGSIEAREYAAKHYPGMLEVPIGAEYLTDCGDVIALNICKEINSRKIMDFIAEVRDQNGLILLPHPFKHHNRVEEFISFCDAVEVFNGRCSAEENQKAKELAINYGKFQYVASDAHFISNCLDCVNVYRDEGLSDLYAVIGNINVEHSVTCSTKLKIIHKSQMIKGVKNRNTKLFFKSLYYYLKSQ